VPRPLTTPARVVKHQADAEAVRIVDAERLFAPSVRDRPRGESIGRKQGDSVTPGKVLIALSGVGDFTLSESGGSASRPVRELKGFGRVTLTPGTHILPLPIGSSGFGSDWSRSVWEWLSDGISPMRAPKAENLDGDVSAETRVSGLPNFSHATHANGGEDLIGHPLTS
jgi:hypothetical protein